MDHRKKLREYKKSESKRPVKPKPADHKRYGEQLELKLEFPTTRYPRA